MLHGTASSSTPFDTSAIHIMPISEHILFLLHFNRTWRQHIICGLFSCILQKWFRLPDFSAFSRNSLEGTRPRVLFLFFLLLSKEKKTRPRPRVRFLEFLKFGETIVNFASILNLVWVWSSAKVRRSCRSQNTPALRASELQRKRYLLEVTCC